jgi:TrmH RNA methyltransferase
MTDSKDENPLYRGPSPKREDSRGPRPPRRDDARTARPPRRDEDRSARPPRRDDDRSDQPAPRAYTRQEPGAPRPRYERDAPRAPQARSEREDHAPRAVVADEAFDQRPAKIKEFRIYGLNACLAAFKKRPESIRKLWLLESRIPKLTELLAFCVKNKIGYNVVENEDLEKLTASAHHEGVCLAVLPQPELALSTWLMSVPEGPCLLIWLDGVGNPHNLGAIMRSAAHFGVQAILLPKQSQLANSGAAARVAEGAAEYVPLVRLGRNDNAIAQLRSVGFELVTTVVRGGSDLFTTALPKRCVLVMGAEQAGVEAELLAASKLRVEIPGSGHVDSLNVSAATAVLLAEWRRQIGR